MKKYFLLFAVGLIACAGSREIDLCGDAPGSPMTICFGDDENGNHSSECLHPSDAPNLDAQQQFDVRVTIAFPRMTLQQAAELEARVRKLFPEAQEIDFGLEKKIEAPAGSFYYDMPDGVEFRTLPGTGQWKYNTLPFKPGQDLRIEIDSTENVIYFSAPSAPREGLKPGSILQADSTGMPAWRVF